MRRLRIPLDTLPEENRKQAEDQMGKHIIIISDEPCLTCGHRVRLRRIDRTDGKKEIVEECLFCTTTFHTAANREGN